jgi:hypothetical protein
MRTHYRRRGTIYLTVFSCGLLVTTIGVTALLAVQVRQQTVAMSCDLVAARLLARAGIDLALLEIQEDADWRTNRTAGRWFSNLPLGDGRVTVDVLDPVDGDLTTGVCDELVLRATARIGAARQMLEVAAVPDARTEDPLYEAVMDFDPLAYWRLGEDEGLVAVDETGRFPGVYRNGVDLDEEVPFGCDAAAWFDGSNDRIEVPHHDDFLLPRGTIHVLFKPTTVSGVQGLISKDALGHDTGGHVHLWLQDSRVYGRLQSRWGSHYVSSGVILADRWHQAALVFGEWGLVLFVDGWFADFDSYTGGLGETSGGDGNFEPWVIGADTSGTERHSSVGVDDHYRGVIDEVAIFDRILWVDELDALYTAAFDDPVHTLSPVPGTWQPLVD